METTSTFVTMLEQFIDELELTFPTETKIKVYRNSFEMMRKTNPRKLVSLFVDTVSPYSAQISQKDESIMLDETMPLNKELNLKHIWSSPNCTPNTKQAIWAHLNTLLMFGSAISQIPAGLMKGIEQLASQYSDQLEQQEQNGQLDPQALLAGMSQMLQIKPN